MNEKIVEINPDDSNVWKYEYEIAVNNVGVYIIYADCLGDALDYMIDYWQEKEYKGLFMSDDEIQKEEFIDEYLMGGNYGLYTTIGHHEIFVIREDINK